MAKVYYTALTLSETTLTHLSVIHPSFLLSPSTLLHPVLYRFVCCMYVRSADGQEFVDSAMADQPSDSVARPNGGETGHWTGCRHTASDSAAAGRSLRVLPHTETRVEQAARLP